MNEMKSQANLQKKMLSFSCKRAFLVTASTAKTKHALNYGVAIRLSVTNLTASITSITSIPTASITLSLSVAIKTVWIWLFPDVQVPKFSKNQT